MEKVDHMLNIGEEMKEKILQGAILNVDYDKLPDEVKLDLKEFSDCLKRG